MASSDRSQPSGLRLFPQSGEKLSLHTDADDYGAPRVQDGCLLVPYGFHFPEICPITGEQNELHERQTITVQGAGLFLTDLLLLVLTLGMALIDQRITNVVSARMSYRVLNRRKKRRILTAFIALIALFGMLAGFVVRSKALSVFSFIAMVVGVYGFLRQSAYLNVKRVKRGSIWLRNVHPTTMMAVLQQAAAEATLRATLLKQGKLTTTPCIWIDGPNLVVPQGYSFGHHCPMTGETVNVTRPKEVTFRHADNKAVLLGLALGHIGLHHITGDLHFGVSRDWRKKQRFMATATVLALLVMTAAFLAAFLWDPSGRVCSPLLWLSAAGLVTAISLNVKRYDTIQIASMDAKHIILKGIPLHVREILVEASRR